MKVSTFSTICSRLDMPLRIIFTLGRPWRNRRAQAAALSWGRRRRRASIWPPVRAASRPPRMGSITHTGMPRAVSRSYFSRPCWRVQSR